MPAELAVYKRLSMCSLARVGCGRRCVVTEYSVIAFSLVEHSSQDRVSALLYDGLASLKESRVSSKAAERGPATAESLRRGGMMEKQTWLAIGRDLTMNSAK
jgi:hypothetical protein